MKRAVGQQLDQLKARLGGYVALLNYRYANLCIEADAVALLPITVVIDGEQKHIEDVAQVEIFETYHFNIYPMYEDDFFAIGQAIAKVHPEFKQEIKSMDGFEEDDPAGKYIFCTMPEVNKDYHDNLLKAIDTLYDECKGKMDLAQETCMTKTAVLMADASESEIKALKDYCDQIVNQYSEIRDTNHDTKTAEVEEAFAAYQAREEERKKKEQEKLQEMGNPMQMVMNAADNIPQ